MTPATLQISSKTALDWRGSPLTVTAILPAMRGPVAAMGVIAPHGADWSKALPMSHGRPVLRASIWGSRRVMSSPTA